MNDPSTGVLKDNEHVEDPESNRGYREKIDRGDGLGMVSQKRTPVAGSSGTPSRGANMRANIERIRAVRVQISIGCDAPGHQDIELVELHSCTRQRVPIPQLGQQNDNPTEAI